MGWIRGVEGWRGGFAQEGFELGEPLLDRVEVGAVGGQGQETRAGVFDRCPDALDPVARQIVEDDDIPSLELGNEELLDPWRNVSPLIGSRCGRTVSSRLARSTPMKVVVFQWPREPARRGARRAGVGHRAASSWSMPRSRRQTPDCPGTIRPVAPAIAGATSFSKTTTPIRNPSNGPRIQAKSSLPSTAAIKR